VTGDSRIEPDSALREFAHEQGASVEAARSLLAALREQAGADHFYVFATSGRGAAASGAGRQRLLLAFLTPDAALAFVQRNQLTHSEERPRLRRLGLLQLAQAVLREPSIATLLIIPDQESDSPPSGHLPLGVRIERAAMLRQLHEQV
jgi:hypothetical protein